MAATYRNASRIEEHRKRIQTTQIINRLQDHLLGKIKMENSQVKAAQILLKKTVPDLATVTHQGNDDGGPIELSIAAREEKARQEISEAFAEITQERESDRGKL
jgi:hypothetical protein